MSEGYIKEIKKKICKEIPEFGTPDFNKMRDDIRQELAKEENNFRIVLRFLKVLLLGDWKEPVDGKLLQDLKDRLLRAEIYAETIDTYYDPARGSLDQLSVFKKCCYLHQVITFIDGKGPGTVTEQTFLIDNYGHQSKLLFFITTEKFNQLRGNSNHYFTNFPAIIVYDSGDLDALEMFTTFRIHRLARIILNQIRRRLGLQKLTYVQTVRRPENEGWAGEGS